MILGFHYHIPAFEKEGVIYTSGFLGVFLESIASNVTELVCFMHTPLPDELFLMDYRLKMKNIRLVSMGPHTSVPRRVIWSSRIMDQIKPALTRIDVLLIRCPTPLLPALSSIRHFKKVFLIVGDYQKSAKDLRQPFFRKKAIQLWALLNKWQQDRAIQNSLVFVNNALIFKELEGKCRKLSLVRTTTLQQSDFFQRDNTCLNSVINLLYVGRLDLSKGLLEMVEALNQVRKQGVNANLHFVGWEEKNESFVLETLNQLAEKLKLESYVFFHGKKQVGDELNFHYRAADIYLIGSKVNEGFPRTIWEAFANSLPVVASKVGSIPLFLKDRQEAILTNPGEIEDLTKAILELIGNSALRKQLINNAYNVAKETTLQIQTGRIIKTITEDLMN